MREDEAQKKLWKKSVLSILYFSFWFMLNKNEKLSNAINIIFPPQHCFSWLPRTLKRLTAPETA
jgi:hypothetical protein